MTNSRQGNPFIPAARWRCGKDKAARALDFAGLKVGFGRFKAEMFYPLRMPLRR